MALEIEGTLKQKLASQSGTSARGNWAKQDFVLEYQDGNFPSDICFTAWGEDKVADLNNYQVGDKMKVAFNIKAREYNGRWYNDLRVWRFMAPGQAPAPAAPAAPQYQAPAPAAAPVAAPVAPAPTLDDMPGETDDMPF